MSTHRCFGHECASDLVQLQDAQKAGDNKEVVIKMGDMQEHRYTHATAFKTGAMTHEAFSDVEDPAKIVFDHFDSKTNTLKSPWTVKAE